MHVSLSLSLSLFRSLALALALWRQRYPSNSPARAQLYHPLLSAVVKPRSGAQTKTGSHLDFSSLQIKSRFNSGKFLGLPLTCSDCSPVALSWETILNLLSSSNKYRTKAFSWEQILQVSKVEFCDIGVEENHFSILCNKYEHLSVFCFYLCHDTCRTPTRHSSEVTTSHTNYSVWRSSFWSMKCPNH